MRVLYLRNTNLFAHLRVFPRLASMIRICEYSLVVAVNDKHLLGETNDSCNTPSQIRSRICKHDCLWSQSTSYTTCNELGKL